MRGSGYADDCVGRKQVQSTYKLNKITVAFRIQKIYLKGKYHENSMSFQNPKMFVCQQKQKYNCLVFLKIIPQCI